MTATTYEIRESWNDGSYEQFATTEKASSPEEALAEALEGVHPADVADRRVAVVSEGTEDLAITFDSQGRAVAYGDQKSEDYPTELPDLIIQLRLEANDGAFRAAYLPGPGGGTNLTGPEHSQLSDDDLIAEAIAEAERGNVEVTADMLIIGDYRLSPSRNW